MRFCLLLAALGVAARLALGDLAYFRLQYLPSHDMSQGLAFFTTSMHSMRLFGDIAWWFPGSGTGYAQYYLGFLSPLAPTYGHVVFIGWAQAIGLLGALGIAIPEYFQYLAVNYLVLPFLAFAAFAWFCTLVLRRRESVVLAMTAYVLSGIGLWDSAWFYFQEPFSVFFLLAATLALVKRPRASVLLAWLAAILVQLASLNYWTLYNVFFVAIVLGAHAATHANQWRRAARRVAAMARSNRRASLAVAVAFASAALAWVIVIGAVLHEQSGSHVRAVYAVDDALARIQEMRRYTTELFNPTLDRALTRYPIMGSVHNARYIGITLLPLILIGAFAAFDRRGRWLVSCAILLLAVCMGFPGFVALWAAIPFMDRVQHTFYFYSQYWQIVLVLLAGVGLDHVLLAASSRRRQVARMVLACCAAGSAAALAWAMIWSHEFKPDDVSLQALLHASLLMGIASGLLLAASGAGLARARRFAVVAVLSLTVIDLSVYFFQATRVDQRYSDNHITSDTKTAPRSVLARPWGPPQPQQGFQAGLAKYLPVANMFWPANTFSVPAAIPGAAFVPLHTYAEVSPPIHFYERARVLPDQRMPTPVSWPQLAALDRELLVERAPPGAPLGEPPAQASDGFSYAWKRWSYNGFEIEAVAPRAGWIKVRQLFTPHWEVRLDGREAEVVRANYADMAVPLPPGTHTLQWDYRPLSRRLYWPAAILLELALAAFLVAAHRLSQQRK